MAKFTGTNHEGTVVAIDGFFDGPGRKAVAGVVLALFCASVLGTLAWDTLDPAPAPKLMGREKDDEDARRAKADWRDGTATALLEYDLKNASRARRWVMPRYAAVLFERLGEAKGDAIIGRGGFVFTADRIAPRRAPEAELVSLPANLVSAVARRLRAAGVDLVVAPIPRKAALYPQLLPRTARPRPELEAAFVAEAKRRGVRVADLWSAFARAGDEPVFHRADTHWNNLGMKLAAEEIARTAGVDPASRPRGLRVGNLGRMEQPGDIARMIGLETEDVRIDPGTFDAWDVLIEGAPQRWQPRLDDPSAATLLSGTSFSDKTAFPRLLAYEFGGDLLDFGRRAIGPVEPLRLGLESAAAAGTLPLRAVWEIPTHNLFCIPSPLSGVASIFAALPPVAVTPARVVGKRIFPEKDLLRPGKIEVGQKNVRAELRGANAVLAGDGRSGVFLAGSVSAPIEISVDTGSYFASAVWSPGRASLWVPVLGPFDVRTLRVAARAAKGAATLELSTLDLAVLAGTDGGRRAAAASPGGGLLRADFATDAPLGLDDVLVVGADAGPGGEVARIVVVFADGSERAYEFPAPTRTALVVPDLADRVGVSIKAVVVESKGGAGASVEASIHPPLVPSAASRSTTRKTPRLPESGPAVRPGQKPAERPASRATGAATKPAPKAPSVSRPSSRPAATATKPSAKPTSKPTTKPASRPKK